MKKRICLLSFMLVFFLSVHSQMNTGSIFASGSTGLNFEMYKSTDLDTDASSNYSTFSFMPRAGYFLKNRIAAGGLVEFGRSQSKDTDEFSEYTYTDTYSRVLVGPFGRFYFEYGGVSPFVDASAGFGTEKSVYKTEGIDGTNESENKHSIFKVTVGGGANYFFNESIAAEGMIQYFNETLKPKSEGANGAGHRNSGVIIVLGITVFFGTI